jgi:serine/threonine protein phosphatase 1
VAHAKLSTVERIYAIGDVHGRFDLLERLVGIIRRDVAARRPAPSRIILLGDLIDRGPESRKVVERCRALTQRTDRFVVLKGNHEALMVDAINGNEDAMAMWRKVGGIETLISWGVPADVIVDGSGGALRQAAREAVGTATLAWLASLPLAMQHFGYFFVHAGIRPGVALTRQTEHDMLWIRDAFLDSKDDHGAVVVHGHSIRTLGADVRPNRIGIDTGAYRTGRLTAIGIEDGDHWLMATDPRAPGKPPAPFSGTAADIPADFGGA